MALDGSGAVTELQWHTVDGTLLVAVHGNTKIVMWDVVTATALWDLNMAEQISALVLDPFEPQR